MNEPLLLSLDTSTSCCSASLTRGTFAAGKRVASITLDSDITHSRRVISCVEYLFSETGLGWKDLQGIAVGLGPGSFTGLRIGMATARGFAAASGLPLLGISTLTALAACCPSEETVYAVLDARKKEVYMGKYRCRCDAIPEAVGAIEAVDPRVAAERFDNGALLVGDGVKTYGGLFREICGERIRFAPVQLHQVSAAAIGLLCGTLYQQGHFLDAADGPLYVRASDAELNLAAKKRKELGTAQ